PRGPRPVSTSMEVIQLYLRLQLLLTFFLVLLLWALCFRMRHQQFFRWWAWAWTSFALFLILRVLALQFPLGTALSASLWLIVLVLGFVQVPLLVLGAWSLLRSRPPHGGLIALSLGSAIAAAGLVLAAAFFWRDHVDASVATRFIPRMLGFTGALLFSSYVFAHRWRESRSGSSAVIAGFFLLCAFDRIAYIWIYLRRLLLGMSTPATLRAFGEVLTGHPLPYFLDIACLCGICLGMVLLVVEEHERTKHELSESNNHSREVAASNQALQAEILERRRVEAALRESEDRYRDLVENSQDLLCTHDLEGKLLSVNPAPARILGYTVNELLRLSLPELIAPEFCDQFAAYISQIRQHGAASGCLCLMTRNGERRVWEYHNTLRTEGVSEPIVRGLAHDVTEQKLAERALRSREEQLRQSQKMEAIGRLAGGIAHDFNNLLLGITLNLEQALRQLGPNHAYLMDYLEQALNATLSAASVTRRLLTFSRRQTFQARPVNLNEVVITTKDLLDRVGGENIHIDVRLQNDLGRVKSDPVQLQQVILNLMLNARDAMPGGGHITIRTENFALKDPPRSEHFSSIPRPGPYVVLEVSDTGTGMDEATLSHAFEPFFTTKDSSTAAGLGLPICYGIVTQSEGHISVRSHPGQGATIRVYLPVLQGSAAEVEPPPATVSSVHTLHPHTVQTVLVVDDTEVVRNAVARDLRGVGYSVLAASSATEAILLSHQRKGPIHLLIVDLVMPGMNGRELARHLLSKRPELRVLFMTGYDKDTVTSESPEDAGETVLYKPFSSLELFAALGRLLDKEAA
ncbi:MAG TPA: ATP-binding protein, partial [Terriglobales bacterium]|nr:ATP-binding protein [Terriglobales bacterium]